MTKSNISKVSLEQYLYRNFIKYDKLIQIVNEAFTGSNATSVNIFIDLYSITKSLYYKSNTIIIEDYSALTSCVINLCAHLRDFFRTRYSVKSKIYIISSRNCSNKNIWPDYNRNMEETMYAAQSIDEMIINNINLLDALCPYLHDIFFISGSYETGVYMYDIICKNELTKNYNPNIIITKDSYNYQLIPMRDHNVVFRPKKKDGEDVSYFLNKENMMERFIIIDRSTMIANKLDLDSGLFTLLLTLSRVPERNLKSIFNVTKAIDIISEAVKNFRIVNGYNSNLEMIWNAIYKDSFNIGFQTFEDRFKVIDIMFQHRIFATTPEAKKVIFPNLYDPETVKSINNQYFKRNPLDLNRL